MAKSSLASHFPHRFIEDAGRPLITEFKQEHANKIFEMDIVNHFLLFVNKDKEKDFGAMLKTVRVVFCNDDAAMIGKKYYIYLLHGVFVLENLFFSSAAHGGKGSQGRDDFRPPRRWQRGKRGNCGVLWGDQGASEASPPF